MPYSCRCLFSTFSADRTLIVKQATRFQRFGRHWPRRRAGGGLCQAGRRLAADRSSVVAVEFALIGTVFLLFVFMIMELVLQLATQSSLDDAAFLAARQIRIGNVTGSNYAGTLANTVCSHVILVPSCTSNLQIYVAAKPSQGSSGGSPPGTGFGSVATATVSNGSMATTKAALTANYDVILQVAYRRPFIVPLVSAVFGQSGLLLMSTMAFQTEPY